MSAYSTKSVLVSDTGIFSELATKLSESFGKVFYTSPWIADYPSSHQTELGEGFSEYERVDDIFGVIDDVDLFVFPELYQGPLQEFLDGQGKRVWGSRSGDELETRRTEAKAYFKTLGIPQAPYEVIKGMKQLRKYIQMNDDQKLWIKIALTRGDTETFSVEGYDLCKNRLDDLEAKFGPAAEYREFIVEEHLPDTLDLAIDTYCIDGKYPGKSLLGNEVKDQGYVGVVKDWGKMPPKLRGIYDTLGPTLEKYQYRNFLAFESRIGKGQTFLGDPCMRVGSPIFELELNMMKNLPDILWEGATGKLVEPEYAGKYGFEVLLESLWANEHPLLVEFPDKYRDSIKLRYATKFPDGVWIMPQKEGPCFGSIVAYGDSIENCFAEVEEIASEIKGTQVSASIGSMAELKKNLEDLAKWGVQF